VQHVSNHTASVDLHRLRYFLTVAEELHYGRAARRLLIAGPSLSQQIKALERELKVQLFYRNSQSVKLTPAGAALVPHARALLTQADQLSRRACDLGRAQPVRFGLVDQCRPDWLEKMSKVAPVRVDSWVLPSHTQATRVSDGKLDLAICHVDTADLKALDLAAHLVMAEGLYALSVGSEPSPVKAADITVLIEADASTWLPWNGYGEEFADRTDASKVHIGDGGIVGRALFNHARRLCRPILQAPKSTAVPLPRDMVRRPVVEPAPLWTWSLVRRGADNRPAVRAVVRALCDGTVGPAPTFGAHWLPQDDPHRRQLVGRMSNLDAQRVATPARS
jgi:DNA-binding transcriptional LysR family regulator